MSRSGRAGGRTSVDDNSGTEVQYFDGPASSATEDYVIVTLLSPITLGNDPATSTVTAWGKGVLSLGEPTDAQKAFMASYTGGDLSGFPGGTDFVAAGASGRSYDTIAVFDNTGARSSDDPPVPPTQGAIEWVASDGRDARIFFALDGSGISLSHSGSEDLQDQVRVNGYSVTAPSAEIDSTFRSGADLIAVQGTAGADTLTATKPSTLYGYAGNDTLNGSSAATVLVGGAGADTLNVASGQTRIIYQAASDSTAAASDVIHGLKAGDIIDATALETSAVQVTHVGANYRVDLTTANGTLSFLSDHVVDPAQILTTHVQSGSSGADSISGVAGPVVIIGGGGSDNLSAGLSSSAVFRYTAVSDSSPIAGTRDTLTFTSGVDTIDARALHATGFSISSVAASANDAANGANTTVTINTTGGALVLAVRGTVNPDDLLLNGFTLQATSGQTDLWGAGGDDTLIAHDAHTAFTAVPPVAAQGVVALDGSFVATRSGYDAPNDPLKDIATIGGTIGDEQSYTFTTDHAGALASIDFASLSVFGAPPDIAISGPGFAYDNASDYNSSGYDPLTQRLFATGGVTLGAAGTYTITVSQGNSPKTTTGHFVSLFVDDTGKAFTLAVALDDAIVSTHLVTVGTALHGGAGNDILVGGSGTDLFDGGAGNDTASFSAAAHGVIASLAAGAGPVQGGVGYDSFVSIENLIGSSFNDTLTGDGGNNLLQAGPGADTVHGAGGNDILFGNGGADILYGGGGNDTVDGGLNNDTMDGGADSDTASYASAPSAVTVSLALQGQAQDTIGAGIDTLINFENLTGSSYNDALTGDTNANVIHGGSGDDVIMAGAGIDTVYGDPGNDTIYGNGGADILYGNGGADKLIGGAGADTLTGGAGNDTFLYSLVTDSTPSAPDLITDFVHGADKIDLTALHTSARDTFTITSSGGFTYVSVDLGGNGSVDELIKLTGANVVAASDIAWQLSSAGGAHVADASLVGMAHDHLASLHAIALEHGF